MSVQSVHLLGIVGDSIGIFCWDQRKRTGHRSLNYVNDCPQHIRISMRADFSKIGPFISKNRKETLHPQSNTKYNWFSQIQSLLFSFFFFLPFAQSRCLDSRTELVRWLDGILKTPLLKKKKKKIRWGPSTFVLRIYKQISAKVYRTLRSHIVIVTVNQEWKKRKNEKK